jgi:phosphoribosylformylglycinamidine cyclo-ligase
MISYKDSGVDKEEGYRAVEKISQAVKDTHNERVLTGLGSFGGLYELGKYKNPVLVSGTDGVGTKLEIAFSVKKYDTVGQDCFAMCANDILCQGADPLFFLDYLACGKLDSSVSSQLVLSMAEACKEAKCALIGGETAEMPGFYKDGDYDMAGFCVGVVEKKNIISGQSVKPGDILIGLPSQGLHSNGYSLVRKVITDYHQDFQGKPIYEELLKPTKVYVSALRDLLKKNIIKGLAHITGGGLKENLPRAFGKGISAQVNKASIKQPDIYPFIQSKGVSEEEMWGTFNMGVGMVLIVDPKDEKILMEELRLKSENPFVMGRMIQGGDGICFE